MGFARKALLVLITPLLLLFLFALAIDTGVIKTAGSSAPIKKILADSDIYSSLVSSTLDQAKTSGGDQGGGVSLTDPAVKQAAENTFTPQYLQQNTEKVLDSVFVWLDGQTPTPDFRIDLSSLKGAFAAEVSQAAQARAATLPACTSDLVGNSDSFDAFSATCLPRGLTPTTVATQVQNDINSGQGFIKNPIITADNLKASGSNQSVFADQLKDAPMAYQKVKKTPFILGLLSLLTIAAIILLSSSRARGLRRVGIILLAIGGFLLIFAWALNYGVNQKALPKLNMDNKVLQEKVRTLVGNLTSSINKTYYAFGGVYAGLGVLAITLPMFIHRGRNKQVQPEHPAETSGPVRPEAPSEHKPEPVKKPPKNIKVQ